MFTFMTYNRILSTVIEIGKDRFSDVICGSEKTVKR